MSNVAIELRGVGKRYRLGAANVPPYKTFRDALSRAATGWLRRIQRVAGDRESFWALKDVSFQVNQGEVVGIIGRNGAGKSTLLKILSRITEPTEGEADIHGRVGSLLEVGTGFHPELSGRENIFLNGAILGMRRAEIARQFSAIVAFAEVERFVDTPVKHYSSGMYTRLAFAVAAHLEPKILIVDEVLAVGDATFQKKCLGKMSDVARHGRTVLFVSHNMAAITRLCGRAILLDQGRVLHDGPAHDVAAKYSRSSLGSTAVREWPQAHTAPGNDIVRLRAARIRTDAGDVVESVDIRKRVAIEMEFDVLKPGHVLVPNHVLTNDQGIEICYVHDCDPTWRRRPRAVGRYISRAWIPGNFLSEGTLIIGVAISTHDPVVVHYYEPEALSFQTIDSVEGDSARGDYAGIMPGIIRPMLEWTTDFMPKMDHPDLIRIQVPISNPRE